MECGEFQFVSFFGQPRRESGLAARQDKSWDGFDLDQLQLKE
jgi:hypothetical protein